MLGPNSWVFLVLLVGGFTGLLVWLVRTTHLAARILAGLLSLSVGTLFGAGLVNNFYDYYTSWSSLFGDLTNAGVSTQVPAPPNYPAPQRGAEGPAASAAPPLPFAPPSYSAASPAPPTTVSIPRLELTASPDRGTGRLIRMELPGPTSGITRTGYVYLPPQYFEPAYARVRFPVLELLHGDPGEPSNWIYGLDLPTAMNDGIRTGRLGPMVVVMPATFTGAHGNDCLNGGGASNDTYLSSDVPNTMATDFRVLPPGPNWGIGGLSDGGYCAANLALRHPGAFGAVAAIDGFFTPLGDPRIARKVFGTNGIALDRNNPALLADATAPLPHFWLMAGTGNRTDLASSNAFSAIVGSREPLRYVLVRGGTHTPPAWRMVLPNLLEWSWVTLSGRDAPSGIEDLRLGSGTPTPPPAPRPPAPAQSAHEGIATPAALGPNRSVGRSCATRTRQSIGGSALRALRRPEATAC